MMSHLKITLLTGVLLFSFMNINLAQIKGNGRMKSMTFETSTFTKFHANFPIQLIIDNNQAAKIEITTDENVLAALKINSSGKQLSVLQEAWVEPTSLVQVKGALPVLQELKLQGYGKASLKNLNRPVLDLNIPVGAIELSGKVEQFKVETETGSVDGQTLACIQASTQVNSFGTVKINVAEKLSASAADGGKVIYYGDPDKITKIENSEGRIIPAQKYEEEAIKKVEVVTVKLKNNQSKKISAYVRGPKEQRFSYGFSFKARQVKTESWPVGTKLYLVNDIGMRKLLYTVRKEDANQTVDLFGL